MNDLVLIQLEQLRLIIREEFVSASTPVPKQPMYAAKPINQKELCAFLGLSEPTVIRWRKKGVIPSMKIGSAIRYDVNKVIEALQVQEKKFGRNRKK